MARKKKRGVKPGTKRGPYKRTATVQSIRSIADEMVTWKAKFLLTEYRLLQKDAQEGSEEAKEILKIIGEVLTITDAAPSLDIKEPKKEKA